MSESFAATIERPIPKRRHDAPRSRTHLGWLRDFLFLALFAGICWRAYGPAINRYFAGDQIGYFAELDGSRSPYDLVRFWNYGADRKYDKGDQALFRPLLFTVMGAENLAFTYHPLGWNLCNLAAHVLVVFLLYKLLWLIRPGPLAPSLAALFAVNSAHIELVLWNHLIGYLVALVFLLLTMIAGWHLAEDRPETSRRWLRRFVIAGVIGSFMYEMVAVLVLLMALHVVIARRRRDGRFDRRLLIACALPTALYAVGYLIHIPFCGRWLEVDRSRGSAPLTPAYVTVKALGTCLLWAREVLTPWRFRYTFGPGVRFWQDEIGSKPSMTIDVIATALVALLVWRSAHRKWLLRRLSFLAALVSATLAFAVLICLGRGERDIRGLTSYYAYPFGLLLIIFFYALVDWSRIPRLCLYAVAVLVLGIAAMNFHCTQQLSEAVATADRPWERYFGTIAEFIDVHHHEPNFSFAVDDPPGLIDYPYRLVEGYGGAFRGDEKASVVSKRLSSIFFARYYRAGNPKYILEGQTLATSRPVYRAAGHNGLVPIEASLHSR